MEDQKAELRRHFRHVRSSIPVDDRDCADVTICAQVATRSAFRKSDLLLPYLSFGAEVETRGIIERAWEAGKTVALPRCVPGSRLMRWHRIESFDGLVRSSLGVEEPADEASTLVDPAASSRAVALVPGLAFDARGYRLGYGGGFYDVFLAGFKGVSMGLCRTAQLVDDLACLGAVDALDLPVDMVICEDGVVGRR